MLEIIVCFLNQLKIGGGRIDFGIDRGIVGILVFK